MNTGGTATGDFQATLLGAAQETTVEGKATAGSVISGGSTFSGNCSVDMGNGTPPLQNVPFIATIGTAADGKPTIALTVGLTSLPAVGITKGGTRVQ